MPASAPPDPILSLAKSPSANRSFAQIYAYSYWRGDSQGSTLAAGGQYGGSQSGLIVTFPVRGTRLFGNGEKLALVFRATVTPDSAAEREFAIGARVRPLRNFPFTVTAERRFRPVGTDRSALYVAGGVNNVALPGEFKLDSYAQGGVVSGSRAGPFYDGSARVTREVYKQNDITAKAGAGAWTGGQRGASRVDIGPSISANMSLGIAQVRIDADWRFRIAGNARPGNGPALTLSTSF